MFESTQVIDKICPVCGKNFVPAGLHMYKDARSRTLVCSWSCMLKSERMNEAKSNELKYMNTRIAATKKALTIATAKPNVADAELDNIQKRLAVEENIYNIVLKHLEASTEVNEQ